MMHAVLSRPIQEAISHKVQAQEAQEDSRPWYKRCSAFLRTYVCTETITVTPNLHIHVPYQMRIPQTLSAHYQKVQHAQFV